MSTLVMSDVCRNVYCQHYIYIYIHLVLLFSITDLFVKINKKPLVELVQPLLKDYTKFTGRDAFNNHYSQVNRTKSPQPH